MNKVLKQITNIMLILLGLGVVCLITGMLLGGSLNYTVDMKNHKMYVPQDEEMGYVTKTIEVDDFKKLDIQIDSADVEVRQGDKYQVSYYMSEWEEPSVQVKNETLTISNANKQTAHIGWHMGFDFDWEDEEKHVTVTVPEGVVLDTMDIKDSYGDICIEDVQVTDYSIDAQSGNVDLSNVKLEKGTIYAEYGDVTWKSVEGTECSLTMESGSLSIGQFTGTLLTIYAEYGDVNIGDSTIDTMKAECESGDVHVRLYGNRKDYDFDIQVEAGDLKINGEEQGSHFKEVSDKEQSITVQSEYGDVDIEIQ